MRQPKPRKEELETFPAARKKARWKTPWDIIDIAKIKERTLEEAQESLTACAASRRDETLAG